MWEIGIRAFVFVLQRNALQTGESRKSLYKFKLLP